MKISDLDRSQSIRIAEGKGFFALGNNLPRIVNTVRETAGVGKIVKGVNTTVDVGVNEVPKQAAKWGFTVDKNGVPPTASTNGKIHKMKIKKREH